MPIMLPAGVGVRVGNSQGFTIYDPARRCGVVERFWSKVDKSGECWTWTGAKLGAYGGFHMNGKVIGSHRVAYTLAHGEIPDGYHVLHRCDNPVCVNPDHLFTGTPKVNMADKVQKNRQRKGERVPGHRLTEHDVAEIRDRFAKGESKASLARRYEVGWSTIRDVVCGVTWRTIN
jgi:hypothetical protein